MRKQMTTDPRPKSRKRLFLLNLLPFLHLCACLIIAFAHLEQAWGYLFLVDIPMSAIILAIGYNYDHPLLLFGVLGTLWWYLLSGAADMLIRRLWARGNHPVAASPERRPQAY
jgi:hypothetical protein